ncbi:MAG: hypothetical protein JST89_19990 [Cyanobacteria bacterium SZAS-4]|nr:hypothetical protein [Cyanobacteria bacterium SZAS-4]
MKIKNAFFGTMLLLINLPLMANPATNSEPTGEAIGTLSQTVEPTDGAAGLFTPNNPGNEAAYKAQLNGGLRASPIVDGSGANLQITVPVATPPMTTKVQMAPPSRNLMNTANRDKPYPTQSRSIQMVAPEISRNVMAPYPVARQSSFRRIQPRQVSKPTNTLDSIGELTGAITYADGQKVLIGTNGNARIDPIKGTVTLPSGAKLSMKSAAKSVRQVALKNQVHL